MQYVNDDMDELFRRAAKDYPLKTNSADWEKVKKKLADAAPDGEQKPSNGNNRRHFLWLLLLLPLPWICEQYTGDENRAVAESVQEAKKPGVTVKNSSVKTNPTTINSSSDLGAPASETASVPVLTASGLSGNSNEIGLSNSTGSFMVFKNTQKSRQAASELQTRGVLSAEKATQESAGHTQGVPTNTTDQAVAIQAHAEEDNPKIDTASLAKTEAPTDSSSIAPSPKKQQKQERTKRFYAGVLGGLDITSIKMQEVKDVGYDAGLVVGYVIDKRWSVEAGLLSSEKAYYTKGEYLPKAYVLPGTKLQDAEGDCRMWEVPLLVRYQFKEGKKGGWFAAAGASSYFMKYEDYTYTYYYMATGQEVERSRKYDYKSNHLFAAAQFSGGYNYKMSKTVGVRVEPYIKLPLQKVGYYDLPLTSFGVHLGVTKKLW